MRHELISLVAQLVVTVASLGVPYLIALIARYVKHATARAALGYVTTLVAATVAEAAAEVRDFKDPTKPGAWNADVARWTKTRVESAVRRAAPDALAALAKVSGSQTELDRQLDTMVEAEVERLRRTAPLTALPLLAARLDTTETK